VKPLPEGDPNRPVRHWSWKAAWEAERMRRARERRQLLHAQRHRGIGQGVPFFSPIHRLLFLSVVKMQRAHPWPWRKRKIH